MYVKDPKTGKESVTLTILLTTAVVSLLKLVMSGITVYGFTFPAFPGSEFALVLGAAGALYWGRKQTDCSKDKDIQE